MDEFDGKVAIVTGGAMGIGAATARAFAEAGAAVGIGDIEVDLGEEVAAGRRGERLVDDRSSGRSTATVLGSESDIGDDGSVYTEYQWGRSAGEDTNQSLVGARKRWGVTDRLSVLASMEFSEIDTSPTTTTRYAVAFGVSYDNGRGLKLSTRNEVRREARPPRPHAPSAGAMANTGAVRNRNRLAPLGRMISLKASFSASAIGCSQPLGPTRFGPMRTCI